jgi:beta-aspartyl-peptidase (threonine type)
MGRFSIGCMLLLATFSGFAVSQEKAIEKILLDQAAAWNAGDIDGYMKGYWNSDSTIFLSGGNLTRGFSGVLSRYKKSYDTREKMGKLEFDELKVRMLTPSLGVVTGVWRLHRAGDMPWGRFTLLVERKPEGWRIIHDHTSSAN